MPRAFGVLRLGEAPAVHDLPIPPAEGAFLIRVRWAGVNPIDYKLLDWLTDASDFPFVVGIDFAGVVERAPAGTGDLRAGDRVFGLARTHGSYAEYTAVAPGRRAERLARIPDEVADDAAAALPVAGLAALGSLELLGVTAGQRVVVMGAAGAVGGYAMQIARSRGAHVIATVREEGEQGDEARRLGAEEVYDSSAHDVIDVLRQVHPSGVDAIVDLVNGREAIRRDAELLGAGGALVSSIAAADEGWFAERQITAYNIAGDTNPASSPDGLTELARLLDNGTITARIRSTSQLDAAGKILDLLRAGGLSGKAVIQL